ncbi:hypothetical protein B0T21DRAFT_377610, partial [Apiosordaria backusii]
MSGGLAILASLTIMRRSISISNKAHTPTIADTSPSLDSAGHNKKPSSAKKRPRKTKKDKALAETPPPPTPLPVATKELDHCAPVSATVLSKPSGGRTWPRMWRRLLLG